MFAACECFLGGSVAACTPNYWGSYFGFLSLRTPGWGSPKLVCVVVKNKKISRDVKDLFFSCLVVKELCRLYKQGALQLVPELLKKRGVMSWAVVGLMGRLGRPIRVRFRDQIRSYLGVK